MAIVGEPIIKLDVLVEKLSDDSLKQELIDIGSKLREVVEEIRVNQMGFENLLVNAAITMLLLFVTSPTGSARRRS